MKNKRVLITGGAGLIGSHIADLVALEEPGEIIILDNFVRGRRENLRLAASRFPLNVVVGDIRDRALLAKLFDGVDIVFHQAAIRITQCAEEPRLAMEVLADGTFNVLEAAVKAGVSKMVAASSASVLGLADSFPTTEAHHSYNNRTIYGAAKVFNEALLRSFAEMYGLDYVALRYFNVYGPRMDVHGAYTEVLIRWMERIAANEAPLIHGDGLQTMDFVHVADIARANVLAAKSGVTDEVFNVASGEETSLLELALMLSRVMESKLAPQHAPARKVNAVTRRLADTSKARAMIGFEARISLEEGLRDLVSWWREERAMTPEAAE
ncbi:NAD-dependent epimerase/dehydratase family protein [Aquamicrobium sp. LC103]|uniref:NAD-dependent epimerase/dehydratase family protein n=1 Tax=Aquamicrobium sp. LC103 TaxID=1120658 RepID=UPI00063E7BFE|nr:NAD-dependent epimerase/dehydratase family protein [Aquamicrobium sp. LC103]TKT80264.1 NAD-dependent epimerase/dehydratase family protein [Aquamicrobium sp. LC103]